MHINIRQPLALVALVASGCTCHKNVDFNDNPALLVEVSDTGIASLDTYQGPLIGPLGGVHWRRDPEYLQQARTFIDRARRDTVAFAKNRTGEIEIWYQTETGAESLNQQLQKIAPNR